MPAYTPVPDHWPLKMVIRRLLLALTLALLISGVFTWLLARKLLHPDQAGSSLHYVVPVHDVSAGEILKADDLKLVSWPSSAAFNGAATSIADVTGRGTLSLLAADQPVSYKQLTLPGGLGLSSRIPAGMRAISLRSDQIVGVAGFLLPGTHTDVLVTIRNPASAEAVTATVLQNAIVLAAGQKTQPEPDDKPSTVDVVTLLVTPSDAERVVLASSQGTVHFLLRNGTDHKETATAPLNIASLALESGVLAAPRRTESPSRKVVTNSAPKATRSRSADVASPYSVVVVRGDKQSVETF